MPTRILLIWSELSELGFKFLWSYVGISSNKIGLQNIVALCHNLSSVYAGAWNIPNEWTCFWSKMHLRLFQFDPDFLCIILPNQVFVLTWPSKVLGRITLHSPWQARAAPCQLINAPLNGRCVEDSDATTTQYPLPPIKALCFVGTKHPKTKMTRGNPSPQTTRTSLAHSMQFFFASLQVIVTTFGTCRSRCARGKRPKPEGQKAHAEV